jgi:hypothetical protein
MVPLFFKTERRKGMEKEIIPFGRIDGFEEEGYLLVHRAK